MTEKEYNKINEMVKSQRSTWFVAGCNTGIILTVIAYLVIRLLAWIG